MRKSAVAIVLLLPPLSVSASTTLLVPAYFDPSTNTGWSTLASSVSPSVPITAIMNPDNGPVATVDPTYTAAIASFQAAGGEVVGYVHTSYGTRSLASVEQNVATYESEYPNITGIFVDEMAITTAELTYYKSLYSYIKTENPSWQVIGNPGTNTLSTYLAPAPAAADELVTFENGSGYSSYAPASWQSSYNPSSFANIVYSVPNAATMTTDLSLAPANNAGNVYFTDGSGTNPYSQLPSYWTQEVAAIAAANGPKAAYIATTSGDYNAAANWSSVVPNAVNAEAEFLGSISANHTVYSDIPITLGTIVFNNQNTYVLGGAGTLTLATTSGSAAVIAEAGVQKITLPITIASNTIFNASSGATLVIDAPVTVQAGNTLTETGAGTVTFLAVVSLQSGASAALVTGSSMQILSLQPGSAATLSAAQSASRLALQVGGLSVSNGATLNLRQQDLIIQNGDLASVTKQIRTGFSGSNGIESINPDNGLATVGVALNSGPNEYSSFDGTPVTVGDLLLRSTIFGDATLDGTVNAADYAAINSGYQNSLTGWSNGDFNYDGLINGSDYTLIDNGYGSVNPVQVAATVTFEIANPAVSAVPEPQLPGAMAIGISSLLRRRARSLIPSPRRR